MGEAFLLFGVCVSIGSCCVVIVCCVSSEFGEYCGGVCVWGEGCRYSLFVCAFLYTTEGDLLGVFLGCELSLKVPRGLRLPRTLLS